MLWNPGTVSPADWDQPLQDETQIKAEFYFRGQQHMAAAIHISYKTRVKQMTRKEGWSQTVCSLSVGHRSIQLAKKQKGRETRSLRAFLAWCFPYVNPKTAVTGPPPLIHSPLFIKAQFSHQLGRTCHLCLLDRKLEWITYPLTMFHPNTLRKKFWIIH